jgi:hypothetical protein
VIPLMRAAAEELGRLERKLALDIGCGAGRHAIPLMRVIGHGPESLVPGVCAFRGRRHHRP